jgi:EAL domain-containing protein (putative c-di-GMP-specific phosphodiesterase class I)
MAVAAERDAMSWGRWVARLPVSANVAAAAVLLAVAWLVVHTAGGSRTAWPHVFYFAIVFAALAFGPFGGLVAGVVASILCGPLMPLDTATGTAQALENWLARAGFFVGIGWVAGAAIDSVRHSLDRDLAEHVKQELDLAVVSVPAADGVTASRVREVLTDRCFRPVFQPIYALDSGRLVAVEALTRFDTEPVRPPNAWFDEAERAGMAVALDLAVIEVALDAARELPRDVALHVNVTPPTLRDPRLPELLAAHRGRQFVVEITEHAVIEDYHRSKAARESLRAQGIQLAVDDAGAGFASLRHIVWLAPEIIKLDMSLTQHVRDDRVRHALAEALVGFATQTGSRLIAEGIEDHADLLAWRRLGAHAVQGHLLARPGPLPVPRTSSAFSSSRLLAPISGGLQAHVPGP